MTSFAINVTEVLISWLPFATALVALGAAAAAMVWLFRTNIARLWLRVFTRIAGTILFLPLSLALILLLLMLACASRPRIIVSPDSQHIARYDYQSGWLGRDTTFVSVRKKWSIRPDRVYEYIGPSAWNATQVEWLDNRHLLIRYIPDQDGHRQDCRTEGADIDVICVTAVY